MAASVVGICNLALGNIGSTKFIDSLDERSKEALVCKQYYESTRDTVLQEMEPNFASRRVVLADTGKAVTGWQYAYAYPTDCAQAGAILLPGMRSPTPEFRVPFEIGADDTGTSRLILCDLETAELRYTMLVTDPNMFSPLFVTALSWALAANIAMPMAVSPSLAERAEKQYRLMIGAAKAQSLNESQEDPYPQGSSINARFS